MSRSKETNQFLDILIAQGWTATKAKSGHWHLRNPKGDLVVVGHTISDYRGLRNARSLCRRYGAKI